MNKIAAIVGIIIVLIVIAGAYLYISGRQHATIPPGSPNSPSSGSTTNNSSSFNSTVPNSNFTNSATNSSELQNSTQNNVTMDQNDSTLSTANVTPAPK